MPTWRVQLRDDRTEFIEADRVQQTASNWEWWTVVIVINEPRWACIRRIQTAEIRAVTSTR